MNTHLDTLLNDAIPLEERNSSGPLPKFEAPSIKPVNPPDDGFAKIREFQLEANNKVLLVDDLPVSRKLIAILLQKLGLEVDQATNGFEAFDRVKEVDYGLIFMDLDMPSMDGFQSAIAIRMNDLETLQHTPIIALTSRVSESERQKCVSSGMDAYISKASSGRKLGEYVKKYQRHKTCFTQTLVNETQHVDKVEIGFELLNESYRRVESDDLVDIAVGTLKTLITCLKCALDEQDIENVKHFAALFKEPCATIKLNSTARLALRISTDAANSNWQSAHEGLALLEAQYTQVLDQLTGISASYHRGD